MNEKNKAFLEKQKQYRTKSNNYNYKAGQIILTSFQPLSNADTPPDRGLSGCKDPKKLIRICNVVISNKIRGAKSLPFCAHCQVSAESADILGYNPDYRKPNNIMWMCNPCIQKELLRISTIEPISDAEKSDTQILNQLSTAKVDSALDKLMEEYKLPGYDPMFPKDLVKSKKFNPKDSLR